MNLYFLNHYKNCYSARVVYNEKKNEQIIPVLETSGLKGFLELSDRSFNFAFDKILKNKNIKKEDLKVKVLEEKSDIYSRKISFNIEDEAIFTFHTAEKVIEEVLEKYGKCFNWEFLNSIVNRSFNKEFTNDESYWDDEYELNEYELEDLVKFVKHELLQANIKYFDTFVEKLKEQLASYIDNRKVEIEKEVELGG